MKSLKDYLNIKEAPEFKEWDMDGKRPARSLSLNSENIISLSSRVDLALEHIKTGYFLRLNTYNNLPAIYICFYNRPTVSEIDLILKALKENKELSKYDIFTGQTGEMNKSDVIIICNK